MSKKKVLIASVLKPVDEPRMYKKLGLSLAENPKLEIHIAGFKSSRQSKDTKIIFHPIYDFKRLSLERLNSGKRLRKLLDSLQPDVLVINTFELLSAACSYKSKSKCVLIYDVRENHVRNILDLGVYSWPLKHLLASRISAIEKKYSKYVDHFFLAEACYRDELTFIDNGFTVLENKYQGELIQRTTSGEKIRMTFAGTIHDSNGVFEAIRLFHELKPVVNNLELKIIGHVSQARVKSKLEAINHDGLTINTSEFPVNEEIILNTYKETDVLLAPYRISDQNRNKIPTKLYDALANGIPIILSRNPFWQEITHHLPWVLHHDFNSTDTRDIHEFLREKHFPQAQKDALWISEKENLLSLKYF